MQHDAINRLLLALNEFDVVLGGSAPAVRNMLRPGLTDEAIDALSAPLLPFVLPSDLRALYRWHNGQDPHSPGPHTPLFHDADYLPLEAAVESYNVWIQVHLNWNPLWFRAFGSRWGLLVTPSTWLPLSLAIGQRRGTRHRDGGTRSNRAGANSSIGVSPPDRGVQHHPHHDTQPVMGG